MQEEQNVSSNIVSTADPEEPSPGSMYIKQLKTIVIDRSLVVFSFLIDSFLFYMVLRVTLWMSPVIEQAKIASPSSTLLFNGIEVGSSIGLFFSVMFLVAKDIFSLIKTFRN